MRKLTEIKQEENEGDFVNSVTIRNHINFQIVIKQEESFTSEAENSVHLNKMASLTCEVKTEPQSEEEDGCELESTAGDYPASCVIKREIVEVHPEDHPMMDNEDTQKTTEHEDSGTEADHIIKPESDNFTPNFPNNNIDNQNNMFHLTKETNKQQICGRIGKKTKISYTQAKTLCETKESHQCLVCAKAFHSSQACLQHMWNAHTGENPYTCEVCGKGFKYLSLVQKHKLVHSDERSYYCDLCERTYKRKQGLDLHKMTVHSDERPYSCDVCDKAFKRKIFLQRHITTVHSDKRPYSCDVCNKAFKQKSILHMHKVLCHSNERPFSCDLCKKMFKRKRDVERHVTIVHSDEKLYSCDVCNKAFKEKYVLQRHMVFCHSNERPYSCELCEKTFKVKGHLNSHIITVHSDEMPYPCNVCKKRFKRKEYLHRHKITVHSDEKPYP